MTRVLRDERGMALAVAIFAMVVAGALVAGAFFAGTQEQRVGQNSLRVQQSFGVGEAAINEVLLNWKPEVYNAMRPGSSFVFTPTPTGGGTGSYTGRILKLNDQLYLVDMTGEDRTSAAGKAFGAGARQRLGWLMRVRMLDLNIGGALTTMGTVKLAGNSFVQGRDTIPDGWTTVNCDTTGDSTKAGIREPDTATVQTNSGIHVGGDPPVFKDPTVSTSTFNQFGDVTYTELAADATIQLPGGTYKTFPTWSGTTCDRTNHTNWGDGMNPSGVCGSYWPIIHVAGNLTVTGDQGQGILLVDGDMTIQGSYQFYGIVIIQGSLSTAGGGSTDAHIWGAVMAKNASLDLNSLSGNATLQYAKCAITAALNKTGIVAPDRSRGWSQLF